MLHLEIHGVPPPKIESVHVVHGAAMTPVAGPIDDMLATCLSISGPRDAVVVISFSDQGLATVPFATLVASGNQPFHAVVEHGQRPVRLQLVALHKATPAGGRKRGISPLSALALAYLALIGHAYYKHAIVVTSAYGGFVLLLFPVLVVVKVAYLEQLYTPLWADADQVFAFEMSVLAWEASQAERLAKSESAASLDDGGAVPRRFIVAEAGDLGKAAARYADTLAWREKNGMDALVTTPQVHYHTIRRFYKQGVHKVDKLGHPVFIEKMGSIDMKGLQQHNISLPDLFRHYLFNMEYILRFVTPTPCPCPSCAESHTRKMLIVLDARGLGMRDLAGESLEFVKNCTSAMQKHYPQQSFKIFLVNVPSWFGMIWKCIKPLLNETTRAKTFILSEAETAATLLQYVDADALPEEYGGSCRYDGGCLDHSAFHRAQVAYVDSLEPGRAPSPDVASLQDDDGLSDEESELSSSSMDEHSPTRRTLGKIMRGKTKRASLKGVVKQDYLLMRLLKHKPFVNPIGLRRLVSLTDRELCIQKSPKDSPVKYALTRATTVRPYHKPNCFEVVVEPNASLLLFTETSQALDAWIQAIADVVQGQEASVHT